MELEEEKHYLETPDALPRMIIDECLVDFLYAEGEDIPKDGESRRVRFLLLGKKSLLFISIITKLSLKFLKWEYNYFIVLCWFLAYNSGNQS